MTQGEFFPVRGPHIQIMVSLVVLNLTFCCGQDMAQWRGPERNGIYNEINLLEAWPENGPELLWVYEGIGRGYAAPAVLNGRIYINAEEDGHAFVCAFDGDGTLIWKSPNGKEFVGTGYAATYPGARSTPTVIGDLVYASSGKGRIACFDAATGAEKWSVDKIRDLGGIQEDFGYAESLAVDDHRVYCFPGGKKVNMAALDRFTGEPVWTSQVMRDSSSYCSPILVTLPSRTILISTSRYYLFALDCSDGKLLDMYKLEGYEWDGDHCNTPLYEEGHIYIIGSDPGGKGAVKLAISRDGESIKEVWYNRRIRNNFGGFIKVGNILFTTIRGNWLKALELDHGHVVDSLKIADGSLVYADDKFICYGTNGTVTLVSYHRNQFEVKGSLKIKSGTGQHFSHPVLADGIMYIRHGNALMAYQIR
jgi:outer membrane protein assembly factor BamB